MTGRRAAWSPLWWWPCCAMQLQTDGHRSRSNRPNDAWNERPDFWTVPQPNSTLTMMRPMDNNADDFDLRLHFSLPNLRELSTNYTGRKQTENSQENEFYINLAIPEEKTGWNSHNLDIVVNFPVVSLLSTYIYRRGNSQCSYDSACLKKDSKGISILVLRPLGDSTKFARFAVADLGIWKQRYGCSRHHRFCSKWHRTSVAG